MPEMTLTKTRLQAGVWEGVLAHAPEDAPPVLTLRHAGVLVPGLEVLDRGEKGRYVVRAPIPVDLIADGIQTFVIALEETGDPLARFSVLAGEALDDDIRTELDVMRAELDMLKRAFRSHCAETM